MADFVLPVPGEEKEIIGDVKSRINALCSSVY